jgi:hypothetical protein
LENNSEKRTNMSRRRQNYFPSTYLSDKKPMGKTSIDPLVYSTLCKTKNGEEKPT